MQLTNSQVLSFQELIFSWWTKNRRDLPWRQTRDPYKIHISEVMLQQTQVSRVIPVYSAFLQTYPTVQALALASVGSVLVAWRGMGYNRRALYLVQTAQKIVQEHNGIYPDKEKDLRHLPGLGIYTARAILVFAYQQQVAFVDTNIKKIIEQHFFNGEQQKALLVQSVADQLLPVGRAWDWHQALMDYGSAIHQKSKRNGNKEAIPFKDTHRFIRGRIMDMVRDQDWEEEHLVQTFQEKYRKEEARIFYNLNNLLQEGLLSKDGNIIHLPD